MTDAPHVHDWQPLPGQRGRYTCACGLHGWRDGTGDIRVARTALPLEAEPTAAPSEHAINGGQFDGNYWRRVEPLPNLDETERRSR